MAILGAVLGGLASPALAQAQPIVMKIGAATINDIMHQWMKGYAALVEKNSAGRIKVEVYPASQLGSVTRMIEGTQFGSIQGFVGPPDYLAGVDTRYELLSAPGLFKDAAHATRTLQDPEFNAAFLGLGANKGLKGIGLFLYGPIGFNSRVPVNKLADIRGMKLRVLASDMQTKQIRLLKGTPVPMPLGDVAPALQQGAIDGQMTTPSVLAPMRFFDVAKYVFDTNHAMLSVVVVINKAWYDKLPADLQKVVSEAGRKESLDIYRQAVDYLQAQSQAWLKGGGEIIKPSAQERAQLMEMLAPIGAEVAARTPADKAMYETLLKAVRRTAN